MRFDDFHAGQVITAGPHEVTEDEIVAFASAWDPQWFHIDPAAASHGPFEGLIASGWHTCAIAMRLVVAAALEGSESYASPGLDRLKWRVPVRPGDRLLLEATVIEARRASGRPDLGVLKWQWRLLNQDEGEALDALVTSLFRLPVREVADDASGAPIRASAPPPACG